MQMHLFNNVDVQLSFFFKYTAYALLRDNERSLIALNIQQPQ